MLIPLSDEFSKALDSAEFEEEGWLDLQNATLEGDDLHLHIVIRLGDREPVQKWAITCSAMEANKIVLGSFDQPLLSYDDHPLLWPYTKPVVSLCFHRRDSIEAGDVISKLYEQHHEIAKGEIPFSEYLNSLLPLSALLGGQGGQLAEGPEPLILGYETILRDIGFSTSTITREPMVFKPKEFWTTPKPNLQLLLLGKSYVIAQRFQFVPARCS